MSKKNMDYLDFLIRFAEYSNEAAKLLNETLQDFDKDTLEKSLKIIATIKYKTYEESHEITKKLAKEFITPIDREDIAILIYEIDNTIDCIKNVLFYLYMHNVKVIREDAVKFSAFILKKTKELLKLFIEFKNFRKSKNIYSKIINIYNTEEEDKFYAEIIRKLHMTTYNAIDIMIWIIIYDGLKKCSYKCKETANFIERIILKNS